MRRSVEPNFSHFDRECSTSMAHVKQAPHPTENSDRNGAIIHEQCANHDSS